MKKLLIFIVLLMGGAVLTAQTYFFEDFEQAFGTWNSPFPAPMGWQQNPTTDIIWPGAAPGGQFPFWQRNVWNPLTATWSIPGGITPPNGAATGTGALWFNDIFPQPNTSGWTAMQSPVINLAGASWPKLSFWYFNAESPGTAMGLEIEVSDGINQWELLTLVMNGSTGTANTWSRISVEIPGRYCTSQFMFRITSTVVMRMGAPATCCPFIDTVMVDEYTPSFVFSLQNGDWNNPATWNTATVPGCDDIVMIMTGHTVTVTDAIANPGIVARCRELSVDGTLNYGTGSANLLQVFGNIHGVIGTINAFNGVNGRMLICGGYLHLGSGLFTMGPPVPPNSPFAINAFFMLFPNTAGLYFINPSYAEFYNVNHLPINNILHLGSTLITFGKRNVGGFKYMDETAVRYTFGLGMGTIDPGNALHLGDILTPDSQEIIVAHGTFATAPIWENSMVLTRNYTYNSFPYLPPEMQWRPTGHEIETGPDGAHIVTGTLTMNSFGGIYLSYPLRIGTQTTGGLQLVRGIIVSGDDNIPTLSCFTNEVDGVDPGLYAEEWYHGSFVRGPMRRELPPAGPVDMNFPLGLGMDGANMECTANVLKNVTLQTDMAMGQVVTARIVEAPSGPAAHPLTTPIGAFAYKLELNSGPQLTPATVITLTAKNRFTGNSDYLAGTLDELFLAQAQTPQGMWVPVSFPLGGGPIMPDVTYQHSNSEPIAPFVGDSSYFAWASSAWPVDDLAAVGIAGPADAVLGIESFFDITISNPGIASQSAYAVQLSDMVSGTSISMFINDQPIHPGQYLAFNFPWIFTEPGLHIMKGAVILPGDSDPTNDVSMDMPVQVSAPLMPPQNVRIERMGEHFLISWDPLPGVDGYMVYFSEDSGGGEWTPLPDAPFVNPFVEDLALSYQQKFYHVRSWLAP
jgi:hypothetical protein